MENTRKKRSNPLGRYNRLVPSTDTEKYDAESTRYLEAGVFEGDQFAPIEFETKADNCCSSDDKQWTKRWIGKEIADIGHVKDDTEDIISQQCITYCDGKLYASTDAEGYLMVIEENRFNKNLKLRPLNFSWGGVNAEDIIDIDVLKLELSGNIKKWVKVKSPEDGAIFLSNNYAFSCPVNEPEVEGGHIYLFQRKRFYKVNFTDKSLSASLPLQNLSEWGNSPFLAMRDLIRLCNQQGKPEYPISKLEDNNEARVNNFGDLPSDILGFIAKKLYGVDYHNFRLVCHKFRLVAPCIKWSEALLKLQSTSFSPWLVFRKGNSCATHYFMDPHSCSICLIKFRSFFYMVKFVTPRMVGC
ncbi:hypothetical protein PTKIN_Ptkin14bG0047800 [Pterospermum kingtungense]